MDVLLNYKEYQDFLWTEFSELCILVRIAFVHDSYIQLSEKVYFIKARKTRHNWSTLR
jgi:hypothetical protein